MVDHDYDFFFFTLQGTISFLKALFWHVENFPSNKFSLVAVLPQKLLNVTCVKFLGDENDVYGFLMGTFQWN